MEFPTQDFGVGSLPCLSEHVFSAKVCCRGYPDLRAPRDKPEACVLNYKALLSEFSKYIAFSVAEHTELAAFNSRTVLTRVLLNRGAHCTSIVARVEVQKLATSLQRKSAVTRASGSEPRETEGLDVVTPPYPSTLRRTWATIEASSTFFC